MTLRGEPFVKLAVYLALAAVCAFMVFPFAWMLVSALKPFEEIFAGTHFLPQH